LKELEFYICKDLYVRMKRGNIYLDYITICSALGTFGFGLLAIMFFLVENETKMSSSNVNLIVNVGLLFLLVSMPLILPLIIFYFHPPKTPKEQRVKMTFLKAWLLFTLFAFLVRSIFSGNWVIGIGTFVLSLSILVEWMN
jgi:hypothetical protein